MVGGRNSLHSVKPRERLAAGMHHSTKHVDKRLSVLLWWLKLTPLLTGGTEGSAGLWDIL